MPSLNDNASLKPVLLLFVTWDGVIPTGYYSNIVMSTCTVTGHKEILTTFSITSLLTFEPQVDILTSWVGGTLAILCVLGICHPQGCFSQFLSGKGAVFSPTVWQGYVFQFLFRKGVIFRPNSLARGVFWSWFDIEILARVVILPFFSGKGGNFCLGRVRVCYPSLHTLMHNLVKSPPTPTPILPSASMSKQLSLFWKAVQQIQTLRRMQMQNSWEDIKCRLLLRHQVAVLIAPPGVFLFVPCNGNNLSIWKMKGDWEVVPVFP